MNKKKISTRVLAEIAIFASMAFALDMLQGGIFRGVFISGGSIGFAMVPIFIISYRRGLFSGLACGFLVSLAQMLGGIYVIPGASFSNPFLQVMGPFFQIMLDYILSYTVVGLAGIFSKAYLKEENQKKKILWICLGTCLGGSIKYACHVISGGCFWLNQGVVFLGIPDSNWLYSFIYNGCYSIPNILICGILMVFISKIYPQFLNIHIEKNSQE